MKKPGKSSQSAFNQTQDYLRAEDAAELLGVHKRSVWRWLRSKKLPGCKLGRTWIVSRANLDRFIDAQIDARMNK